MSSYNNRLGQVIALHRRSERQSRKRGPDLVRGSQAAALKSRPRRRVSLTEDREWTEFRVERKDKSGVIYLRA